MQHHPTSAALAIIPLIVVVAIIVIGALLMRRKGYSEARGETIVRCREGHLFMTIWIPGVSFKAVRLGMFRLQRCPIDNRFTLVAPVDSSTLTDAEKQFAAAHHDVRLP